MKKGLEYGYSLVSFLVYLAMLGIISLIVFQFSIRMQQVGNHEQHKLNALISLSVAHDVLMRDISQAPAELKKWKRYDKDQLIWRMGKKDIGWAVEKNMLIRSEGLYSIKHDSWKKRTKSIVAFGIKNLKIAPSYNVNKTMIQSIDVMLTVKEKNKKYVSEQAIALVNRVLE